MHKWVMSVLLFCTFSWGTSISLDLTLNELLNMKSQVINAQLSIEVDSCEQMTQNDFPTKVLLKQLKQIHHVFPKSIFKECRIKDNQSMIQFSLPILLNTHLDKSINELQIINSDHELLSISIPSSIRKRIFKLKNEPNNPLNKKLSFYVNIRNDLNKAFNFKVISAYIDQSAFVFSNFDVVKHKKFEVKLSDVSLEQALKSGYSRVLLY